MYEDVEPESGIFVNNRGLKKKEVKLFDIVYKIGTSASGNRNHAGRPGQVGGSGRVYHGTTSRVLKKILVEGIRPQNKRHFNRSHYTGKRGESVFVAKDFKKALKFADACVKGRQSIPVVFKVRANPNSLRNDVYNIGCKMKKGGFNPEDIISYSLDRGKSWHKPEEAFKFFKEEYYVGLAIFLDKEEKYIDKAKSLFDIVYKIGKEE